MNAPAAAVRLPPEEPHRYQLLIDGAWTEARSGERTLRSSPGHDVPVSDYALASAADVDLAVAAARRAFESGRWTGIPAADRARVLFRTAAIIRERADEVALLEALEVGKPIAQARAEVLGSADIWEYAASMARALHGETYNTLGSAYLGLVLREPLGVVGIITPWNFPFLILSERLPFALAAGCTTVVKPSELTSASDLLMHRYLEEAGLPAGVANIVTGPGRTAGQRLIEHPDVDMVAFTGSTAVGRQVLAAAGSNIKKVSLELGGKNPQVVFADADLDAALDAALFHAFFNTGECCVSGSRLVIERVIADEFAAELAKRAATLRLGDPLDEASQLGAITSEAQGHTIMTAIEAGHAEGARLLCGGARRPGPRLFIEPAVFANVDNRMRIAQEEIFGPVLSVIPFEDADEAVRIANDTPYGLAASVWSRDVDKGIGTLRRIRAGRTWLNTALDSFPDLPFGGYKQSGLGRECGRHGLEEYTELKTITAHFGPRTEWWHRPAA